jgi:uncharacterized membrane protein
MSAQRNVRFLKMQALKNFRTYFLRGVAAVLPTILTIWILVQCYLFVQNNISNYVNRGLVRVFVYSFEWYPSVDREDKVVYVLEKEPMLNNERDKLESRLDDNDVLLGTRISVAEDYWVRGPGQLAGLVLTLIGVVIIGAFLASFIGRSLWHFFERTFTRVPLINSVYPHIKQITDFLLTRRDLSLNKVVAIQYPRAGVWSVALVTGSGIKKIVDAHKREFLTVFVPTSPTPFTGYVIMTPKDETIELDMTIEEALRFTVSGGVITPAQREAFEEFTSKKDHREHLK